MHSINLQIDISQKQTVNQQIIQSVKILQMSSLELNKYLEELCLENPVMELDSPEPSADSEKAFRHQLLSERSIRWLMNTDRQNHAYYEDDADGGNDFWQDSREQGESLEDFLHSQILTRGYSQKEEEILDFLIHSLDSHGYLTETVVSTAEYFHLSESFIEKLFHELRSLEPAGIGASSLIECLLLQVERLEQERQLPANIQADHLRYIIQHGLKDLGRKHLKKLQSSLDLTASQLEEYSMFLRSLNPHPANSFTVRDYVPYVIPDAYILEHEKELEVLISESGKQHFHENSYYVSLASQTNDPTLKKYLMEKIRQLQHVRQDISQRNSTVSRVIHLLVQQQADFFYKGPGNRVPLGLRDIADSLELHESTISRAMQGKYLQCKWGIYPLNYFLTSAAVSSGFGIAVCTRESIEQKIRSLIKEENPHKPLSDQKIADLLSQNGIAVSRRTVNKYRIEMGIPDKSGRKK